MKRKEMLKNLTLKPVELQHLDQFNRLLRYVFQVTNQDIESSGYQDGELERAKRPILRNADVFGWFAKEDELVAQVAVYPCKVNIHGTVFDMGGLTAVGTYPEYAGYGLAGGLIQEALSHMRKNKQWISYLYPYSIPFYRKKGWEIMSDHLTFSLKDSQLPKDIPVPGHVQRFAADAEEVRELYHRFALKTHGALLRNQLNWDEYWRWENEEERIAGVYIDENGIATGYVLYWIAKDAMHIKDMVYLNQNARRGLWNFISAHHSMVTTVDGHIYRNEPLAFFLDDGAIKQTIAPYYMARIVDVEQFLRVYPFEDETVRPFHFVVSDPLAKWNNGIFGVEYSEEGFVISRNSVGQPVTIDIQTLTTMLMGYRRPAYLRSIERLNASTSLLRDLEKIIPDEDPYFSDYF